MNLDQFTGTDNYYRHQSGLMYTDGIQYLAEEGKAYWLLDAIGSYQAQLKKNQRLQEFQLWELRVQDRQAVLTCKEDSDCPDVVRQEIEYTDFPLEYVKVYVEGGVILLPSEH